MRSTRLLIRRRPKLFKQPFRSITFQQPRTFTSISPFKLGVLTVVSGIIGSWIAYIDYKKALTFGSHYSLRHIDDTIGTESEMLAARAKRIESRDEHAKELFLSWLRDQKQNARKKNTAEEMNIEEKKVEQLLAQRSPVLPNSSAHKSS
eukprot:TRINITY_DN69_c0_g1_i1.p1 TRINITY_DN69_c0_g1~~TRINITY_DN69_c0_g1_i1.p1  ORF type:complete len:149 (-),score=18.99 TRINITY_DN69_c0_g1_i1:1096-1542(-)